MSPFIALDQLPNAFDHHLQDLLATSGPEHCLHRGRHGIQTALREVDGVAIPGGKGKRLLRSSFEEEGKAPHVGKGKGKGKGKADPNTEGIEPDGFIDKKLEDRYMGNFHPKKPEPVPLCEDLNNAVLRAGDKCFSECGLPGHEICNQRVLAEGLRFQKHEDCTNHIECAGRPTRILCEARLESGEDVQADEEFEGRGAGSEESELKRSGFDEVAVALAAMATSGDAQRYPPSLVSRGQGPLKSPPNAVTAFL